MQLYTIYPRYPQAIEANDTSYPQFGGTIVLYEFYKKGKMSY